MGPLKAARTDMRSQYSAFAPGASHLHTQLAISQELKKISLFSSEVRRQIEYWPIAKLPLACVVARASEVSSMGDCRKCKTSTATPAEPGGLLLD